MKGLVNTIVKRYLTYRYRNLMHLIDHPFASQKLIFDKVIQYLNKTSYAADLGISNIKTFSDYKAQVPLVHYDDIQHYIHKMMLGETNVLMPGKILWYAKSSGTSTDKSKYIPLSDEYLYDGHIKCTWDITSCLYHHKPDLEIFSRKNLFLCGSIEVFPENPKVRVGDVSAIKLQRMPSIGKPFYTPDFKSGLLSEWDKKLEVMIQKSGQDDVVCLGGVPSWCHVLCTQMLDYYDADNMFDIWPNAKVYTHGGVGFEPYKTQFEAFFPDRNFQYYDVYNASEGYFAAQLNHGDRDGLPLLVGNGVLYEFLMPSEVFKPDAETINLEDVELDIPYALVISTISGLYRYVVGDVVQFTSLEPFKINIVGRISQYINTFGEELMVNNTDKAIAISSKNCGAQVKEYSVAPIYFNKDQKGGHEWWIEFEQNPDNVSQFMHHLDIELKKTNSDYEAKRFKNLALDPPTLKILPKGTFERWMKHKGKYGVQNKIPRLRNDRSLFNEIESILNVQ